MGATVQTKGPSAGSTATESLTLDANPTIGNKCVAVVWWGASASPPPTPGGGWVLDVFTFTGTTRNVAVGIYRHDVPDAAAQTAARTFSIAGGGTSTGVMALWEFSGLATGGPDDSGTNNTEALVISYSTGTSGVPTNPNGTAVAAITQNGSNGGAGSKAPTNSFTLINTGNRGLALLRHYTGVTAGLSTADDWVTSRYAAGAVALYANAVAPDVDPTVDAGPNVAASTGVAPAAQVATETDPDGTITARQWYRDSVAAGSALATGAIAGQTTATLSGASQTPDVAGAYVYRYRVTGTAAAAEDSFTLTAAALGIVRLPLVLQQTLPDTVATSRLRYTRAANAGADEVGLIYEVSAHLGTSVLWTPGGLPDLVEVEMADSNDARWRTLRGSPSSTALNFEDREFVPHAARQYRSRVTRTDGSLSLTSDWSEEASVTPTPALPVIQCPTLGASVRINAIEFGAVTRQRRGTVHETLDPLEESVLIGGGWSSYHGSINVWTETPDDLRLLYEILYSEEKLLLQIPSELSGYAGQVFWHHPTDVAETRIVQHKLSDRSVTYTWTGSSAPPV